MKCLPHCTVLTREKKPCLGCFLGVGLFGFFNSLKQGDNDSYQFLDPYVGLR